jgi:hypothetical protein
MVFMPVIAYLPEPVLLRIIPREMMRSNTGW